MNWREIPIHVVDFEGSTRSGVVEYGVVTMIAGEVTHSSTRLCAPTGVIDEAAYAQHGISEEMAKAHPSFEHEWEYFTHLRQTGPLAAHHAVVEHRHLCTVWPYPGLSPDFLNTGFTVADWGPWMDTRQLAQAVWPGRPSYKLGDLIEQLDLSQSLEALAKEHCPSGRNRLHCALYDALGAALLFQTMMKEPSWSVMSLEGLLRESVSSVRKRQDMAQGDLFD